MRGRTFNNTVIIADEMQNSTPNQMKMLLTRIGENTKLIITGDLEQSDLGEENGLAFLTHKLYGMDRSFGHHNRSFLLGDETVIPARVLFNFPLHMSKFI